MPLYDNFSADPGSNTKAPPLGAPEGATQFKVLSDTLRVLMASDAELGALVETAVVPATDQRIGLVELATGAEVIAGLDGGRVVTPLGLAQLTATDLRKGLVELATTAEAIVGASTALAVTPAGVKAVADAVAILTTKANPGSIRFPNGLTIRFGFGTTASNGVMSHTYSSPFTSIVYHVSVTVLSNTLNYCVRAKTSSVSALTAQVFDLSEAAAPAGITVYWLAIGD